MSERVKDVLFRAIKTFLETAGAYLLAHLTGVNFFEGNPGKTFWIGLALSTGAAGLAFFNWKAIALAAVLLVLTRWVKFTKNLHPILFILASAVVGVVFEF